MRRDNLLARLIRALSGKTQEQLAEETGVPRGVIAQIELGESLPGRDLLAAMAERAGITLADAEEILRLYETRRRPRRRWGRNAGEVFDRMAAGLRGHAEATFQLILTLPLQDRFPQPQERERAEELFARLERRPHEVRLVLVQDAEEFQTWYLCERVCLASVEAASRDLAAAADWVEVAQEIAARVRAPEGFRRCLQGYALAHASNVLRVSGKLKEADATFEEAKRLWESGADPAAVLDPGRLPDLEGSLRRDQRRFEEALACFAEVAAVGRYPERALINKGFTLEVMGEYERAVQTLLQAEPERLNDERLIYMQRFNFAVCLTHVGRYGEAGELVEEVSDRVGRRGDEIEAGRVVWLRGRIAAGLGRRTEALGLLKEARREFERRKMSYDVALALLEEAVLLLEEGRAAEVKALAEELTQVFADKGVHREALAALRLFHEAAEREEATTGLARRVLQYLFRARYDPELRFEGA